MMRIRPCQPGWNFRLSGDCSRRSTCREPAVDFRFFEILMEEEVPRYTYRLREGITDERIGMYILKKAGVVDLIRELDSRGI